MLRLRTMASTGFNNHESPGTHILRGYFFMLEDCRALETSHG